MKAKKIKLWAVGMCILLAVTSVLATGCAKTAKIIKDVDDILHHNTEQVLEAGTDNVPATKDEGKAASAGNDYKDTPDNTVLPGSVRVSNVDELLGALGSGITVILAKGTYDLTTAADYGTAVTGKAYTWEEVYDGFQLVVHNSENLTLCADDADNTSVITTPRYAQVILFDGCTNITVKDITLGHTPEGVCGGAVLEFDNCTGCTVDDCHLYGCGIWGVSILYSSDMTVTDSDIYSCSYGAVNVSDSASITVTDCDIHDCGKADDPCVAMINLTSCSGVTVTETEVERCTATYFVYGELCNAVSVQGCELKDSSFFSAVFYTGDSGFTVDGNEYENVIAEAFVYGDAPLTAGGSYAEAPDSITYQDSPYTEYTDWDDMEPDDIGWDATAESVPAWYYDADDMPTNVVSVRTADEFLAAVCSDTLIRLEADIDLTTALSYGKVVNSAFFRWDKEFDGYALVIYNVEDFSIVSDNGHVISTVPRYANVLTFEHCEDILLDGVTVGHTEQPGTCSGGVLSFDRCDEIEIIGCHLYGCGIIGIDATQCEDVHVISTEIFDCSDYAVRLQTVKEFSFLQCDIHDCGTPAICLFDGCKKIRWDGESLTASLYVIEDGKAVVIQ